MYCPKTKKICTHEFKCIYNISVWVMVYIHKMTFSATFKDISDKSWRSDLLVEETGVPGSL